MQSMSNLERWKIVRARGKTRFILVNGVLFWGVMTAVLFSIMMQFMRPERPFLFMLGLSLVLFPLGGFFWGVAMWNYFEWRLRREAKSTPTGTHPQGS